MHLLGKLLVLDRRQGRLPLHLEILPDLLLLQESLPILRPQRLGISLFKLVELLNVFWLNSLLPLKIRTEIARSVGLCKSLHVLLDERVVDNLHDTRSLLLVFDKQIRDQLPHLLRIALDRVEAFLHYLEH